MNKITKAVVGILGAGGLFVFAIMGTDNIYDMRDDTVKVRSEERRFDVEKIVSQVKDLFDSEDNVSQVTPSPPSPSPGVDGDFTAALIANGIAADKADIISKLFSYFGDDLPVDVLCGLGGNICGEGAFGRIENLKYTRPSSSINIPHQCPITNSTIYWAKKHADNNICPLHIFIVRPQGNQVTSLDDCKLLQQHNQCNQPGVGCIQWSGGRRDTLLGKYIARNQWDADGYMLCEFEMFNEELHGSYKSVLSKLQSQNAYNVNTEESASQAAETLFYDYVYKNGNPGDGNPHNIERKDWSVKILRAYNAVN